jgi:hypothetical protein
VTPVPLDLPIRPPEAAELARLIFQQAEGKRLSDDVRGRIASRSAQLRLETIRPFFGSLAREPLHHSTYYLAVDGGGTGASAGQPLLLHIAPPSAPTSGIFHKPLLIGRFADVVLNAIPFGPDDKDNIAAFVARIDPAFAPRPQGARPAIAIGGDLAAAFEAFRGILRRTGKNLAASCGVNLALAQWSAIRAGWREGYSAVGDDPGFTHFAVEAKDAEEAARQHGRIRQARSAAKLTRPFDFELSFAGTAAPTTPAELRAALSFLKEARHAPQWVTPRLEGLGGLEELAGVARLFQCGIGIVERPEYDAAALDTIARVTAGRFFYKVCAGTGDAAARVEFLAAHLA